MLKAFIIFLLCRRQQNLFGGQRRSTEGISLYCQRPAKLAFAENLQTVLHLLNDSLFEENGGRYRINDPSIRSISFRFTAELNPESCS